MNLQSDGSDSLGLTLKFDDSEQLIVEEIQSDGIADKVHMSAACKNYIKSLFLYYNNIIVLNRTAV